MTARGLRGASADLRREMLGGDLDVDLAAGATGTFDDGAATRPVRIDDVDGVLGALADPTRRLIVTRLSAQPTATATELARELPVSRQAVVKHLATLRSAHLVGRNRRGRESRHHLEPEGLRSAQQWLADVEATWDARLERLTRLSEPDGE